MRREGHKINHKCVLRLYREEGLKLRPKKRRKVVSVQRVTSQATTGVDQRWSMDFVSDIELRAALSGLDSYRLSQPPGAPWADLALEVDTSLNGERVVRVLERLKETRGLPEVIQTDPLKGHPARSLPAMRWIGCPLGGSL